MPFIALSSFITWQMKEWGMVPGLTGHPGKRSAEGLWQIGPPGFV